MSEEENAESSLDPKELEIFYEVLFKRIMDIIKRPDVDLDPFGGMIKILVRLSEIFSFRSMISLIPELVAFAMKYGMLVEKSYEEEVIDLEEDIQGFDSEEGQQKRVDVMRKDLDKLNLYL
ncbi:MAG: hypothetical protein EAX89_06385 [Candidatus Lokiarchaeota archaeon]|nr:hypothetical protein [Candidatus Lokiarchaeota archaeon]